MFVPIGKHHMRSSVEFSTYSIILFWKISDSGIFLTSSCQAGDACSYWGCECGFSSRELCWVKWERDSRVLDLALSFHLSFRLLSLTIQTKLPQTLRRPPVPASCMLGVQVFTGFPSISLPLWVLVLRSSLVWPHLPLCPMWLFWIILVSV